MAPDALQITDYKGEHADKINGSYRKIPGRVCRGYPVYRSVAHADIRIMCDQFFRGTEELFKFVRVSGVKESLRGPLGKRVWKIGDVQFNVELKSQASSTTTVAAATGVPATAAASAATQPVKWTFTTEKANEKKIRDHLRVKHKTGKVGESISQHGLNKKWFVHWDNGGQTFCKESNLVQEPLEEQRRRVVRYDCYAH